ncbi:MAG: hypothetical protein ACFCVC_08700 [Acidimicrobiia bacterium]
MRHSAERRLPEARSSLASNHNVPAITDRGIVGPCKTSNATSRCASAGNATGLVLEGIDLKTAQTRLGHTDPRLTLGIYAQATTEGDRQAGDRLGDRFLPRRDNDSGRGLA